MAKNTKIDKRLANLKPFKKGDEWNGNAKGAAKGPKFKTVIKRLLELPAFKDMDDSDAHVLELVEKTYGRKFTNRDLMVVRQVIKATRGDGSAFDRIADREEGKPTQPKFDETKGLSYTDFLDGLPDDTGEDA